LSLRLTTLAATPISIGRWTKPDCGRAYAPASGFSAAVTVVPLAPTRMKLDLSSTSTAGEVAPARAASS
jgi:hypothetical protein